MPYVVTPTKMQENIKISQVLSILKEEVHFLC